MAARLLDAFEKQQDHRMGLETMVIQGDSHRSWAGLILGFILALVIAASSGYLVVNGYEAAGVGIIVAQLATLGVALIYAGVSRRRERDQKRD